MPLDHRVDIYALGVMLYELLTGRVPFEGESFMAVLAKHASKQVPALRDVNPRVKVSAELENVVFHALRKERDERFQQHARHGGRARAARRRCRRCRSASSLGRRTWQRSRRRAPRCRLTRRASAARPLERRDLRARAAHASAALRSRRCALLVAARRRTRRAALASADARRATPRASDRRRVARASDAAADDVGRAGRAVRRERRARRPRDERRRSSWSTVRITTEPAGASVKLADGEHGVREHAVRVRRRARCSGRAPGAARRASKRRTNLTPTAATDLHLVLNRRSSKPSRSSRRRPRARRTTTSRCRRCSRAD